MTLNGMTPAVSERFDRLCKLVAARGKGLSLSELGTAHALAREIGTDAPDPERVDLFRQRLGLTTEQVAEL